jgi:cytoskeletal protein RodZ
MEVFEEAERARRTAAQALTARVELEEEAVRARLRAHETRQAQLRAEERAARAKAEAENAEQARLEAEAAARRARIAASARAVLARLTYVLAWTGGLIGEPESEPAQTQAAPRATPAPSVARERVAAPAAASPSIPIITLSAVRGDCWLSVRAGTQAGQTLYEGVLAQGDELRFKQRKLWLRLGAASNLEISVDGKPAEVPAGTVDVVLPA